MSFILKVLFVFCFVMSGLHADKGSQDPKLLVFIIASDDLPIYIEHQKIWRSYMHLNPEQVEAYFIKSNPDLKTDFLIDGDVIWIKQKESITPGILNKTIKSMEIFLPRILNEFDFVLRSNLSSFFVFPRLLKFLKGCQKQGLYTSGGVTNHYGYGCRKWAHGCGFVLSPDLVQVLVENQSELYNRTDENDDVILGDFFLRKQGYSLFDTDRMDLLNLRDWELNKRFIPDNLFHFRVKNCNCPERRLLDDLFIYKQLLLLFYPKQL